MDDNLTNSKRERQAGELRELVNGFAARIQLGATKRDREEYELTTCGRDRVRARARCTALANLATQMRRANMPIADMHKLLGVAAKTSDARWTNMVNGINLLCTDGGAVPMDGSKVPTFAEFAKEWTDGDLHKRYPDHVRDADTTRSQELLRLYINPVIGDLRLDEVSIDDAQRVMTELRERTHAARVSRKQKPKDPSKENRRKVAKCINRVLKLAEMPGRHITRNPIPAGWVPKKTKSEGRAKGYLYPEEDAKLLGCVRVPFLRRLAYGILMREGMRTSELAALTWECLDLKRGLLRLDDNKTDCPRVWVMREDVARALKVWKKRVKPENESERVLSEQSVPIDPVPLAKQLRRDLKKADVLRAELSVHNEQRMQMRAHDLRGTFVTIALANGKTETWVADRTGHTTSDMINTYRRTARQFSEANVGDLGQLDELLPDLAPRSPHELRATQDSNLRPTAPEAVALSS